MYKKKLLDKISTKKAKIAIIGLGYVGLPLAINFTLKGFSVLGIDSDKEKVLNLNNGKSYINQFSNRKIKEIIRKGFKAYYNFNPISEVDIIIYCLPTPVKKNKSPEMKYITKSIKLSKNFFKKGQIISFESTTYPGTTEEYFLPALKKFSLGKNFFLAYSPEREDPGNNKYNLTKIPKVISGYSKNCLQIVKEIYSKLNNDKIVSVSSLKTAEMTKLLENIYRSINIGLVNELKILTDKMGINIFEVINAAKTKPFGYKAFYPGPGLGGHCIPIDPFILSWKAKQFNFETKFIYLSGEINSKMPRYVFNKTRKLLSNNKIKIQKSKILILGVSYKKNVDDIRESPALELMNIFKKRKIYFDYSDPYIPKLPKTRKHYFSKKSVELTKENIKKYTILILITDHDKFNYLKISKYSTFIVDCRGKYKPKTNKIILA